MAVKTITIDLEAYEILARHKRAGQSFSQVIKQRLGGRMTGRDLAQAGARARISERTLDAIDIQIRFRHTSLARAPKPRCMSTPLSSWISCAKPDVGCPAPRQRSCARIT